MYVCGQKKLLSEIDQLIESGAFPRFSIIVGNVGTGKKVISDYIARKLGANFVPSGIKAEEVRDVIDNSYTVIEKTLYMFADSDYMSVTSKNSLLKVTEEPPNNSYFIMTVRDLSNVLETIISRAMVFHIEPYSESDLDGFIAHRNYSIDSAKRKILKQICLCPQDITVASDIDIKAVYDVADKFIQFIGSANLANELKISTMLNLKSSDSDKDGKIDPIIFMRCIMLCCNSMMLDNISAEDAKIFHSIISETSRSLIALQSKGCNKQEVVDNWIVSTHMAITGGEF